MGRRKRSIECDPGHGWFCPQAEESRQTSPLLQNFRSSPDEKGNQVCDHIFRLTSQSASAFLVRVSLRAKSSEMCFGNEVIITYAACL